MKGKVIIFSAPSGSGKSTIINYLLTQNLNLRFSISATNRAPRGNEQNGKEYYFMTLNEFKEKIQEDAFLEYEEVYPGCFYGTLKSEVERIVNSGANVVFDVDVAGGRTIKKYYGKDALSVFIQPPSIDVLKERLESRGTDSQEVIAKRLEKAEYELTFAPCFDTVIINDNLERTQQDTLHIINQFINQV